MILLISASHVARITGMSHCCPTCTLCLKQSLCTFLPRLVLSLGSYCLHLQRTWDMCHHTQLPMLFLKFFVLKFLMRVGRMAQVVGCLPSECEVLGSNSTTYIHTYIHTYINK
jgi:hypothetical protein